MSSQRSYYRYALVAVGLIALAAVVLVSLPFAGMLAFVLRLIALVAVPVFILAVLVSPAFRAWLNEEPASVTASSKGLVVPSRVMLHKRHGWARPDGLARVSIGVDDLMQRVIGPVDRVSLPEVGQEVNQGEPLFEVGRRDRSIAVKSPISGTVVRTNGELEHTPRLINASPYDLGWTVVLKPAALGRERRSLLRFETARDWFLVEVDRLIGRLNPALLPAPALQDGGALIDDLHDEIDDEAFERIRAEFF